MAVVLASHLALGKLLRIFLTFSSFVRVFPRESRLFTISVNLLNMLLMDSSWFILNNSYCLIRILILVCLTWLVPSYVTTSLSHISLAVLQEETQLNSSLFKPQNKRFIALKFFENFSISVDVKASSDLEIFSPTAFVVVNTCGPFWMIVQSSRSSSMMNIFINVFQCAKFSPQKGGGLLAALP